MTDTLSTIAEHLAASWCRMWNDEADLAHDLMTDDCRMWSGSSDALDDVVGPARSAAFVEAFRRRHGLRYTPRVVVADGADRLAYLWDATAPDGTVLTGLDVNVLRSGRVAENWTLVGGRRAHPTPATTVAAPVSRGAIEELCHRWTSMWNGETSLTPELVTDDFGIWFGAPAAAADDRHGPDAFAAYVEHHRADRPSLTFAEHRDLVIDTDRQRAAVTWTATLGERRVGGIDLFALRDGRFARAWSITGTRDFGF